MPKSKVIEKKFSPIEVKRHEMGNNMIRRGGGLQRTPPRSLAEAQSLTDSEESKSPVSKSKPMLERQKTEFAR